MLSLLLNTKLGRGVLLPGAQTLLLLLSLWYYSLMIRKTIFLLSLFALIFLNACNTVKGTATGVGRDAKAIWHYTSCAWDWDKDCQKK